jgi:heptaprenyl diphosphate synthase
VCDVQVRRQLLRVERFLAAFASPEGTCPPYRRQLLSRRSKRLRPALLLLTARFAKRRGGDDALLERAAAGLELVHEGTLYHDDILDRSAERRGEPTVARAWGPRLATLAGLEVFYGGAALFAELPAPARRAVGRACRAICEGNLRDLEVANDLELSVRDRLRIMRGKGARFFELAARLGTGIGGAPPEVADRLIGAARWFGMSFQLADDLTDIAAREDHLGRPPGGDLREGVYTLPTLFALRAPDAAGGELRACLARLRREPSVPLLERSIAVIRRAGGIAQALALLARWTGRAEAELAALPPGLAAAARRSIATLIAELRTSAARAVAPAPTATAH